MASKRYSPNVNIDDPQVERAIDDLYNIINELSESVNSTAGGVRDFSKGQGGDIRVVKDGADDKIFIEAKGRDGTYQVELSESERDR